MLRHSVLFIHRDDAGEDEKAAMLRNLAYLGMEIASVRAGDYGQDVMGGSSRLREVPPWTRPPRFRLRGQGAPAGFDAALHLDFEDRAGLEAYEADPARQEVARFNDSVAMPELTACLDWRYDGDPPGRRGHVRHCAMHVWRDDAAPEERARVLEAAAGLAATAGVESVAIGENVGTRTTDYDWLLDVEFADAATAAGVLGGEDYARVARTAAAATKDEWTARVTHLIRAI